MKNLKQFIFILFLLMVCYKSFNIPNNIDRSIGKLPVMHDGRVKPLDTVSRHYLLKIQGKQSLPNISPTQWLFGIATSSDKFYDLPVILIEHPLLFASIDKKYNKQKFTVSEAFLDEHIVIIEPFIKEALQYKKEQRSPFLQAVYLVYYRYQLIKDLRASFFPFLDQVSGFDQYVKNNGQEAFWEELLKRSQSLSENTNIQSEEFLSFSTLYRTLSDYVNKNNQLNLVYFDQQWMSLSSFALSTDYSINDKELLSQFLKLPVSSNIQLKNITESIMDLDDPLSAFDQFRVSLEYYFNLLNPFIVSLFLYFFVMIFSFMASFDKFSHRFISWTWILALIFHTFGLLARFIILLRPPVINLYSSAIFIAFVASVIGFIMFKKTKRFFYSGYISALTCLTLIVAYHLSLSGDTLEVMEAVLNSNFWLATHVVSMTIGYAVIFMAGFFAIAFILIGALTKKLTPDLESSISRVVYIFLMVSLFFNLLGTVLGGIWADQSWGRFWGWDPKENGAILIVLWTAIILHLKWGRLIKNRGLMNLTVLSNIVTAWSWKGTNMLGIGLHSYGFTEQTFYWLIIFFISQISIVSLGLLPRKYWNSPGKFV